MHLVIALIGVLSGLLLLFRLWRKSRAEKLLGPKSQPFHALRNPVEVVAVLALGIAKCEGDISQEQETTILNLFVNEFNMSEADAGDLFSRSAGLLKNETSIAADVEKIIHVSRSIFSQAQVYSMISLMGLVSEIDSSMSEAQEQMIMKVRNVFLSR